MNEKEVVELMLSSKSELEWNANCDKVKASHSGLYPEFWFVCVILSGVLQAAKAKHGW